MTWRWDSWEIMTHLCGMALIQISSEPMHPTYPQSLLWREDEWQVSINHVPGGLVLAQICRHPVFGPLFVILYCYASFLLHPVSF